MVHFKKYFALFLAVFLFSTTAKAVETPKEWTDFLDNLKKEMLAKGISEKTLAKAYDGKDYYHVQPEVVERDKKQTEFVLTSSDYLNRLVTAQRVATAREHYRNLKDKYQDLEQKYQVPLNYLIAFWAVETNFGQNKGRYQIIDSLTNLSYKNRRANFFKNELYNVLKIMDQYDLENDKIMGSWAGAMGHFQFMPSTFNAYAIDYDNDGVIDIWDSFDDAIGSAANYLSSLGWKYSEPWGMKVVLPWNFDYQNTGYKKSRTVEEWNKMGIRTLGGKKLPFAKELKASVIVPDGYKGSTYIVLGNFRRIMIWNRSENYALAIGHLADYIASKDKPIPFSMRNEHKLTGEDIEKIQEFSNKILHTKLKVDGKLGYHTKEAVKKLQLKAKLHPDGYPNYQLLNKINKYNPKIGFAAPLQPSKAKKTLKK